MTQGNVLSTLLSEKRYADIEAAWRDALADPVEEEEFLLVAARGLSRAGQKSRLQTLAGATEAALRTMAASDPAVAKVRWNLLKEAVRAAATPSTSEGFHKLFEEAITAAYPNTPSLTSLLGKFKFREAKDPADGLLRIERVEKWIPFEVGRCFTMAGRGAGRVVETNFALDSVRMDFEKAKGIAVPIGVAAKSLVPLPEGHFLNEKLTDPATVAKATMAEPSAALKRILESFGRALTVAEVKEAVLGLVPEESWASWWTAAKKHPNVVMHGTGKNSTVEWSHSADAAEDALFTRFEKASLKDKLDLFKKNAKRSPALEGRLAVTLAEEARKNHAKDPSRAFEIATLLERTPGITLPFSAEELVPDDPAPLLLQIGDRQTRERLLELYARKRPDRASIAIADWFFKEEDVRTIEALDRRLAEIDPDTHERTLDKLLKSPRSGPRAFLWFAQKATTDDALRARLTPNVLARLLDAVSWDELGASRSKVREMFDRTALAAIWIRKHASLEDARTFLDALSRHHELEPHRRDALVAAAEMKFPNLRKGVDETFFVTPESLEAKRLELERILKVEIPENTKGIALAAAEGDLSENFEYKARRDKQQLLSARAGKIQDELTKARALDPAAIDTSEVRPGTRVTLRGQNGSKTVTLLGPWDSKPEEGVYSYLSDLGKALLGKTEGEAALVLGEETRVEKIEPWR